MPQMWCTFFAETRHDFVFEKGILDSLVLQQQNQQYARQNKSDYAQGRITD